MGETDELKIILAIQTKVIDEAGLDLSIKKVQEFAEAIEQNFGVQSASAENAEYAKTKVQELANAFKMQQSSLIDLTPIQHKYGETLETLNKEKKFLETLNRREQSALEDGYRIASKLLKIWEQYPELLENTSAEMNSLVDSVKNFVKEFEEAVALQERLKENQKRTDQFINSAAKAYRKIEANAKGAFAIITKGSENAASAMYIFQKALGVAKSMAGKFAKTAGKSLAISAARAGLSFKNVGPKIFGFLKNLGPVKKITQMVGGGVARLGGGVARMAGMFGRAAPLVLKLGGVFLKLGPLLLIVLPIIIAVTAAVVSLVAVLAMVALGFKLQIEMMEKFRTANYRALGSIRGLSKASFGLMKNFALTSSEASGVIQALSKAGFTAEGLAKNFRTADGSALGYEKSLALVAGTNAMFTKATGVSADVTAAFQKRMDAMGVSAPKVKGMLDLAAGAMKKFGMTGEEVSAVLSKIRDQSLGLETLWGEGSSEAFGELQFAASGLAKELGLPVGQMQEFMDLVGNANSGMAMLVRSQLGVEPSRDMKEFALQAAQATKSWQTMATTQGIGLDIQKELLEAWGLNTQQIGAGVKLYEKFGQAGSEAFNQTIDDMKEMGEIQQAYSESIQTLPQKLNQLFGPILYMASELAGPLVDGLIAGLEEVMGVTFRIGSSEGFEGLKATVAEFVPIVKEWGKFLVKFIGAFLKGVIGVGRAVIPIIKFVVDMAMPLLDAAMWVADKAAGVADWIGDRLGMKGDETTKKLDKTASQMEGMNKILGDMDKLAAETGSKLSELDPGKSTEVALRNKLSSIIPGFDNMSPKVQAKLMDYYVEGGSGVPAGSEPKVAQAVEEIRTVSKTTTAAPNYTVQFTEETAKTNEHLLDLVACCSSLGDVVAIIRESQMTKDEISLMLALLKRIADSSTNDVVDPWRRPGGIGGRGEANTGWVRRFG